MNPHLVVDIGNTRIKWGLCTAEAVVHSASLPSDDPAAWQQQLEQWQLAGPLCWVLTAVQPENCARLAEWVQQRGDQVALLQRAKQLPLRVLLEKPDHVGIDRLLDAVAANQRRRPGQSAILIDAGSAVTVDWVDAEGAFRGGAIFPGLRLMAHALHDYTALLPLLPIPTHLPEMPGTSTPDAMAVGIVWTVIGGIRAIIERLRPQTGDSPDVFLTGGDAGLLRGGLPADVIYWPLMTLEGVRFAASLGELGAG
jgi:type III pantothenate kinase